MIIVAPDHAGDFLKLLGSGKEFGCDFAYEIQDKPAGLAEAFIIGKHFIANDNATLILGDNLYEDDFSVELSVDVESAIIYYTLDCSDPTEASAIYSTPIFVEATTVIRARAFKEGWLAGPVATATYLFDSEYSLDVISLVTQNDNFWGSSGIYQNPYSGIEKPIHFEYFTQSGEPGFNINLGVKIHSPDNRQRKSLRLYARSQYGENEINYKLFDD